MTARGPRVLVTAASRHGSTHQIAGALARGLTESTAGRDLGLAARWLPAENRPDPSGFDAVVLGSAVYAGRWLAAARSVVTAHTAALRARPLWLFSSGPIGAPPFPPDEPYDAGTFVQMLGARGHRVLPGRLEESLLSFEERAMVTAMRAPVGDSRDWCAVAAWGEAIAAELAAIGTPVSARPSAG